MVSVTAAAQQKAHLVPAEVSYDLVIRKNWVAAEAAVAQH